LDLSLNDTSVSMYSQPLIKVFQFNGGYCHILRNHIAFLKLESLPEDAVLPTRPDPVPRIYLFTCFFGLVILGFGIYGYFKDFILESCFIATCGAAIFLYSYRKMILSRIPVIERDRIVDVRFRHGVPGQTASRFIIFFKDDKNRLQERVVVLTNRPDYGDETAREAIAIMNRHFEVK
jgi:hypothetical protein